MAYQPIDTGETGGSKGPWLAWTSNGSMQKNLQAKSWALRGKDQDDNKFEHNVPAFENGCVIDLDSLQLGWMKDGGQGMAPIKQWNPSAAQSMPRPDDSKKTQGTGYAWSQALSVRCAIGDGQAATWEQASYGAYDAFAKLTKQINAEWEAKSQNGALLPLVKQTDVETQVMKSGSSNKPVLTIVEWVARPDCLKDDAPAIDPGASPAAAQAAAATTQPADTGASAGGF